MADLIPPHGGVAEPITCTVTGAQEQQLVADASKMIQVPVSDADLSSVYRFARAIVTPDVCEKTSR